MKTVKIFRDYPMVVGCILLLLVYICVSRIKSPFFVVASIVEESLPFIITVLGAMFVMTGGGIDFSAGCQIMLVNAVLGLSTEAGLPDFVVMLMGLLIGLSCGALNGLLVSVCGMIPFFATIISQILFKAAGAALFADTTLINVPEYFFGVLNFEILGIKISFILVIAVVLFVCFVFNRTFYGKKIIAMGENKNLSGAVFANLKGIEFSTYVVAGFFYALSSIMETSAVGAFSSTTGPGKEITAMIVIFVSGGGTYNIWQKKTGGKLRVLNVVACAVVMDILSRSVMILTGVSLL